MFEVDSSDLNEEVTRIDEKVEEEVANSKEADAGLEWRPTPNAATVCKGPTTAHGKIQCTIGCKKVQVKYEAYSSSG